MKSSFATESALERTIHTFSTERGMHDVLTEMENSTVFPDRLPITAGEIAERVAPQGRLEQTASALQVLEKAGAALYTNPRYQGWASYMMSLALGGDGKQAIQRASGRGMSVAGAWENLQEAQGRIDVILELTRDALAHSNLSWLELTNTGE